MEKNTGKTETLNYVLSRLCSFSSIKIGITSIGIDGEKTDQVTNTHKPEITLYPNTIFVTAEQFYNQKEIIANILSVSNQNSALGRLVTAKTISSGKVKLAGPGNTSWLKNVIEELKGFGSDIVLVDGALSRMSFGSPSITDAMVLSTGAALSIDIKTLVKKTAFVYRMSQLPQVQENLSQRLINIEQGIWAIDNEDNIIDLKIPSILMIENNKDKIFAYGKRIFISGIITDKLMQFLLAQKDVDKIEIIIRDFTRVFASIENINRFLQKQGKLYVAQKTNLIAITVNPTSPSGYNLNSEELINVLKQEIPIPIYNIKEI